MRERGKVEATERERREILRVAACWEALHDWPEDLRMTREDVKRCGQWRGVCR